MYTGRLFSVRRNICKSTIISNLCTNNSLQSCRSYIVASCTTNRPNKHVYLNKNHNYSLWQTTVRTYCSKTDKVESLKSQEERAEKDLKKLKQLFPIPRVTLHNLNQKTPQKVFDITFKQSAILPKGSRKKGIQKNDWTCTYTFVWPEKMKFEFTSISKQKAAEVASVQALLWLYRSNKIDNKGCPIYDEQVISNVKDNLNEPLSIEMKDTSVTNINGIWKEYEERIKSIYETTFQEAEKRAILSEGLFRKDSSLEEDDEFIAAKEYLEDMEATGPKALIHPVYGKPVKPPSSTSIERRERVLQHRFTTYDSEKVALPIDDYCDKIQQTVANNRVTILVGAAGCGKSTRAPAAVLRGSARCNIIVSEPRRVAAIGLANRVAQELGEAIGETVGYQVRLQAKLPRPPTGSILYCTSGVLLRRLQSNPGLTGCTHVIIDEAHERDVNTDLTLLLLKEALKLNEDLKIIVMSATLDVDVFTKYFDNCPVIEVPGRTYPVTVLHLDDIQSKYKIRLSNTKMQCENEGRRPQVSCDEVVKVITAIDKSEPEGAILVFLPGWMEIKRVKNLLDEYYSNSSTHLILPVHSRLTTQEQSKMFSIPPPGVRKIVISTNIAETSVTVPDVLYVVDSGLHKENTVKDNTGITTLETVWISQASAKQRTGRAGRVQPGHCYRLYTKEKEAELEPHMSPEILRVPLEQIILELKTFVPEGKIQDFMCQLPEPPRDEAIQRAVNDLIDLGAFTQSEKLTRLGSYLSLFALPPRLSLSLLHARVCSNLPAISDVLPSLGGLTGIDTSGDSEAFRNFKRQYNAKSDHTAMHWILHEFEKSGKDGGRKGCDSWCQKNCLRADRLGYMRALSTLYLEQLLKSPTIEKTVSIEELNHLTDIDELTPATILSGSNSLLITRKSIKTKGKLSTQVNLVTTKGERAHIGSDSVNYGITKRAKKAQLLVYYGGFHSTDRRALVVHMTSLIPPHTALIFSKGDIYTETRDRDEETTMISLPRHKLSVHMLTKHAEAILKAREMLWNTFDFYIERDINTISYDDNETVSKFKSKLMKGIARILVEADDEITRENTKIAEVR